MSILLGAVHNKAKYSGYTIIRITENNRFKFNTRIDNDGRIFWFDMDQNNIFTLCRYEREVITDIIAGFEGAQTGGFEINNYGSIIWTKNVDGENPWQIYLYSEQEGQSVQITNNTKYNALGGWINDRGQITYQNFYLYGHKKMEMIVKFFFMKMALLQ